MFILPKPMCDIFLWITTTSYGVLTGVSILQKGLCSLPTPLATAARVKGKTVQCICTTELVFFL